LLAVNPVFLHYSVAPVTGIPASLCLVLALDAVFDEGGWRRGLRAGLWGGLAILFAFKSVMFVAIFGVALLVRERWRGRSVWLGYTTGLMIMLALQLALDRWIYGQWGASLGPYLVSNAFPIVGRWCWALGLKRIGAWLYTTAEELQGMAPSTIDYTLEGRQAQGRLWYFMHMPRVVVWPVLALGVIACVRAALRPAWKTTLVVVAIAVSVFVMSSKGSKNFRLLLPVLPLTALLGALGWDWMMQRGRAMHAAAIALLLSALPLGLYGLGRLNLGLYSGYWDAMEHVNRAESSTPRSESKPIRVAAAFDWAIYLREAPRVTHSSLPFLLDQWSRLDVNERAAERDALDRLDYLLVHLPVIEKAPEVMAEIQPRFEVRAAFYDAQRNGPLGPVLVLGRREGRGPSFFDLSNSAPSRRSEPLDGARAPLTFFHRGSDGDERLTLLAVERERIAGTGLDWIEYTWRAETSFARDYRVVSRITGPGGVHLWNDRHDPAYGTLPMTAWKAGAILREGYLVVPHVMSREHEDLRNTATEGGQTTSTAEMWIALIDERGSVKPAARLELVRAGESEPARAILPRDRFTTDDGLRFTRDWLTYVGSLPAIAPR
jgi:hypothetical protein